MTQENRVTTDHDEIRQWAQERGGRPVRVKADPLNPNGSTLQIDFLFEKYDDNLTEISWDEFFSTFEREKLAFVFQNETDDGKVSRFGRLVRRNEVPQAVIE